MQTKFLLNRRTTLGLWGALVVVLAIAVLSAVCWSNVVEENRWVEHSHTVLGEIAWVLDDLEVAETQERGYILTGNPSFLSAYHLALQYLKPRLMVLHSTVQDSPIQLRNSMELEQFAQTKVDIMNQVIGLRRPQNFERARQIIASDLDRQPIEAVRRIGGTMVIEEQKLLRAREQQVNITTFLLLGVIVGGSLILFVLVAGSVVTIQRDLDRRERLQQELEHGKQELMEQQEKVKALNVRLRRAMAETHHRVKNNLQVLTALAEMQIDDSSLTIPAAALLRVKQHVQALATVHDILTKEARENEEVEYLYTRETLEKLRPLMQSIVGARPIRFTVEDMCLPIRQGTSLVVLINELVSNAVKHGEGEISLLLTLVGDGGRLQVRDEGPGFPIDFDPTASAHTGLELIESLGHWDLGGTLTFANHPEGGACVTVDFPLRTDQALAVAHTISSPHTVKGSAVAPPRPTHRI